MLRRRLIHKQNEWRECSVLNIAIATFPHSINVKAIFHLLAKPCIEFLVYCARFYKYPLDLPCNKNGYRVCY